MNQNRKGEESGRPPAYPQTGVANTCRSYREYVDMFGLTAEDFGNGPVLDVAGGASSFTAQMNATGIRAVAADPFYGGAAEQVVEGARKEIELSSAKLAQAASAYDWSYYGSPERHRKLREESFGRFAEDFTGPDAASRYVAASLPRLPFEEGTFGLALCSHFLFLYGDTFGETFHREAIAELLRVVRPGGQVRIYPVISLKWEPIAYLDDILSSMEGEAEARFSPAGLPFIPIESAVLQLVKKG